MSKILLKTKLHIPQMRISRVQRPHLVMRLKQALEKKLIMISAPAGYGKTTLITEWLSTINYSTAWISLDKGDNDVGTFWLYLTHALQHALQMECAPLNKVFNNDLLPSNYLMLENCLVDLINELDQLNKTIILVLDDYQVIQSQDIHSSITFLINHAPACFHLVIITRADPPLNLAFLRGRSTLAEFRLADLRFSDQEIFEFMQSVMQLNLSDREISTLAATTEGWIAGLQLAGLSLRGKENTSEFIETFGGEDRYIMDFLLEEVLNLQPEHIRNFLLQTSRLERLSAPLCDALIQDNHSQSILCELEKHNLFLIALDDQRKWYRYHHLFRDLLRNHLSQMQNIDLNAIHHRACCWYESEGEFELAISHALAGQDFEHMAVLLEKIVRTLDLQNQQLLFTSWLDKLPIDVIIQHPWLCVYRAWGAYWTGNLMNDQENWLLYTEKAIEHNGDSEEKQKLLGYLATIKAHQSLFYKNIPEAIDVALEALEYLPKGDVMRCEAMIALAGAYWALGDIHETKRMFALTRDTALNMNYFSMAAGSSVYLGIQQVKQGLLTDAIGSFTEGLRLATLPDRRETPMVGIAYCRLGDVWREQNKLEAAVDCLERGLDQCQILGQPDFLTDAYLCYARYHLTIGDLEAAHEILDHVDSITRQTRVDPWIMCWRDECRIRTWIAEGNQEAINLWGQNCGLSIDDPLDYQQDLHHLNLARMLVARYRFHHSNKDFEYANVLLDRLQVAARLAGWVHEDIRILILKAINFHNVGFSEDANQNLVHAVALAQPGKFMSVFLDEGDILCGLFKSLCDLSDVGLGDFLSRFSAEVKQPALEKIKRTISQIYAAFRQTSTIDKVDLEKELLPPNVMFDIPYEPFGEKLTPREMDVLRLLANGFPDKKIAETLVITRETVHKHLKNIYQKLNVHSRTEAVIRAQALGLFSD